MSNLGFTPYKATEAVLSLKPNESHVLAMAKRNHAEAIYNIAALENSPYTFPEVQTLLDGITVGGHKLSDQQLILNQDESWKLLFKLVASGDFRLTKALFLKLHGIVAKDEALAWGEFRTGNVRISGTDHRPPAATELNEVFDRGLRAINNGSHPVQVAINFFLLGALNQFFWDGNKRTARLMANGLLLDYGYPVIDIPAKQQLEFNTLMVDFYDTKDGQPIGEFLEKLIVDYV